MEQFRFEFNAKLSTDQIDKTIPMINLPITAVILLCKNLIDQFYLSFLGPVVFNTVAIALKATGEDIVAYITGRQLMEGWKVNMLQYINTMLEPFRTMGISWLPDLEKGFIGLVDNSFGITTSIGYFVIGPFEAYTRSEDNGAQTVAHAFKFDGSK